MATALDPSWEAPTDDDRRRELEERYRQVSELWPKDRVEIIHDRIVVSPVPTWAHERLIARLLRLLMAVIDERGWDFSSNISLFLGAQRDRYKPDLTVAPTHPPLWGNDHVHGQATVLVVEVVSDSSRHDDQQVKPTGYAAAGVPLCLVIDTFRGTVRLLSSPDRETARYERQNEVPIGKAIELPEPWNLTLDTGKLTD
ncbi:MAG TPA: Uma2 family endonuclease [Streptosporangiaceae bacterium]